MFSIHSVSSDRELIFSSHHSEYFYVEFKGAGLSMSTQVWQGTYEKNLISFFQELAGYTQPWLGELGWESLEKEFAITATCTTLGHVFFQVNICYAYGSSEEWSGQVSLETELGQIPIIARQANAFFHDIDH